MTSIIPYLASSLGRRDERPNILLAENIVIDNNQAAIRELMNLCQGANKTIAADAIKVIYEIGQLNPMMLQCWIPELASFLKSTQNRLQWGTMIALSKLTGLFPKEIFKQLSVIIEAMHSGSVITKDHGVKILVALSSDKKFANLILPILLEFIHDAPINQFPSYAERIGALELDQFKEELMQIIRSRLPEFEIYPAKTRRLVKILNS